MEISVFGSTGFVGSEFCKVTKNQIIPIDRESRTPKSDQSLYFISTTDNYNVFSDLHKDIDVNLSILVDVLKNLTPKKSVINFISSWFVYGDAKLPAAEDFPCNPKGFYSITKKCAEDLLVSYCQTFGVDYRILRLCNVYGTGDKNFSKKKNALKFLIEEMRENRPIGLYHDGNFLRDYMHVTDIARAIDLCLESAPINSIINIGSGEKVVFKDIINQAQKLLNSKSEITKIDPPQFHNVVQVKDFYMDTTKLKNLGFTQTITLKEGIETLCKSKN